MSPNNSSTFILTKSNIFQIVDHYGIDQIMDDLIDHLEEAIRNLDDDEVHIPIRSGFNYKKPHTGLIEWMPIYTQANQNEIVIKVVGYHPENPGTYQLPTILSTISAYDTKTGHLKALVDGVFLTALRTGAASAIASRRLAKKESKILGLIGCGAQAVTQLHALSRVFNFEKVLLYDIDSSLCESFRDRCSLLNLNLIYETTSLDHLVQQADILCTATSIEVGEGPLFNGIDPLPHAHINAVGSDFPGKTELPLDLLNQSFVCPDFKDQALKEGECQQLETTQIGPSLAEVIQSPDRYESIKDQLSVFDSTGWALEDQVVLELFCQYAKALDLGQYLEIESMSEDAKNPYDFISKASEPDLLQQLQGVMFKRTIN